MIAVDTNILLRYLLDDDAMQSRKARHLFETKQLLLITDVVLAETIWTLKGKRYAAHRDDIAKIVMRLLEEVNVIFEDRQAIWSALNDFVAASPVKTANGIKWADFSDALIVNKARCWLWHYNNPTLVRTHLIWLLWRWMALREPDFSFPRNRPIQEFWIPAIPAGAGSVGMTERVEIVFCCYVGRQIADIQNTGMWVDGQAIK